MAQKTPITISIPHALHARLKRYRTKMKPTPSLRSLIEAILDAGLARMEDGR
jgi:hypothetical protein